MMPFGSDIAWPLSQDETTVLRGEPEFSEFDRVYDSLGGDLRQCLWTPEVLYMDHRCMTAERFVYRRGALRTIAKYVRAPEVFIMRRLKKVSRMSEYRRNMHDVVIDLFNNMVRIYKSPRGLKLFFNDTQRTVEGVNTRSDDTADLKDFFGRMLQRVPTHCYCREIIINPCTVELRLVSRDRVGNYHDPVTRKTAKCYAACVLILSRMSKDRAAYQRGMFYGGAGVYSLAEIPGHRIKPDLREEFPFFDGDLVRAYGRHMSDEVCPAEIEYRTISLPKMRRALQASKKIAQSAAVPAFMFAASEERKCVTRGDFVIAAGAEASQLRGYRRGRTEYVGHLFLER